MSEEHEHTVVTHLYHVKIPYHMTPQEIQFEDVPLPRAWGPTLVDLANEFTEEEIRIVMQSVVLLLEKYPHRKLSEALDTAIVWLRG